MRVDCEVERIDLEGDYGPVEGVCIRCGRCGHEAEVYGATDRSVKRGLVMLREECPEEENNFYVAPEGDE